MIIYVCGKKGFGKTTFVKRHIVPKWNRIVVLDSLGFEYPYLSANNFSDYCTLVKSNITKPYFRIAYTPFDKMETEFFKLCLVMSSCLIVIEETDLYCTTSQIEPSLDRLVRYGRHRNLDLVFLSRRPAEVHRNITAQADVIISFRQTEPRDLEYFKQIS